MKVHLYTRKPSFSFRILTWSVVILFAAQDLSAYAAVQPALSPEIRADTASFIKSFNIPESWGQIEDRYLPPDAEKIPAQPLIYIQDAHAQPDAQRKIQSFLEYLAAEKLADGVFVEGASGKLSSDVLDLFQDKNLNLSMAEYLLELGELTGAEYYVLKNGPQAMPVYGIENPELYKASFKRFHDIKTGKKGLLETLKQYRQTLEKLQILTLSADLQEYVIRKMSWKSNFDDLAQYINVLRPFAAKHLKLDFSDTRLQFEWPGLVRFSALEEMDRRRGRSEKPAVEAEKISLALEAGPENALRKAAAEKLREITGGSFALSYSYLKEEALPGVSSYREFFELLRKETKAAGIDLFAYPEVLRAARSLILREELESKILFEEIERLERVLEEKLVSNSREKELLALTSDFLTAEKMLGLSLTRKEYDGYVLRKDLVSPKALRKRLTEAAGKNDVEAGGLGKISEEMWRMSEEFYVLSLRRDRELLDNALSLIGKDPKEEGVRAKVLIAGGFHSEGLRELLKEKEIPHIVVMPRISKLSEKALYEKVMLGEHSRLEFLAEGTALVKMLMLQEAETYAALRPDASPEEQSRLVFKALHDRVVPELREKGLSNRAIFELLSREISMSEFFQGTRLGIEFDAEQNRLVFGEFDASGELSAAELSEQTVSTAASERTKTTPAASFPLRQAIDTAAAGPAALSAAAWKLFIESRKQAEPASRSELREIPVVTTGLTPEEELKLLEEFVLPELRKAQRGERAELPVAQTFSDIHGGLERLYPVLIDRILSAVDGLDDNRREEIAKEVLRQLSENPLSSMLDLLASQGIDMDEVRRKTHFQNLGDLVDRGPDGLKVIRLSEELVNMQLSSFVLGNHDVNMLMSLLGFHLPWYGDFEFYGYEDQYGTLKDLIAQKHLEQPETKDKNWWAQRLDEFMKYQKAQQKAKWALLEARVSGEGGLYERVKHRTELSPEQERVWGLFRGFYLVKVATGVSAAGLMSNQWWQELLDGKKDSADTKENFRGFRELYAELAGTEGFDSESDAAKAWREAITMIEDEILAPLQEDFKTKVEMEGKWWWRVFDAINYKNFVSPEWYALDWATHGNAKKGWGPQVMAEQNGINRLKSAQDPSQVYEEVTLANYLNEQNPSAADLHRAKEFLLGSFNLYLKNIYQVSSLHSFLPIVKEGPYAGRFYFEYKGQMYMGKGDTGYPSIWEGLDRIAADVRNAQSMQDFQAPFKAITRWYADKTTESKPHDIAFALNTFGPQKIAELNGFEWLTTGHVPIKAFYGLPIQLRKWISGFLAGERFPLSDRSWAAAYGRWGGFIEADPNKGMLLYGYESAVSEEIIYNPRTLLIEPGADSPFEMVLFDNEGLSQKRFADMAVQAVENRISVLKGESGAGAGRPELRANLDAETFLEEASEEFAELWYANQAENRTTLVGISGGEASGKTMLTRQIAERTAELVEKKGGRVRVLSLDRFFLDRHRRRSGGSAKESFLNKWEIGPEQDASKTTSTSYHMRSILEALRKGDKSFIPFFLNQMKQRVRITPSDRYTDPVTRNINGKNVRRLTSDILKDTELLENYARSPAEKEGGRRFLKLYEPSSSGETFEWNFNVPGNDVERERMEVLDRHIRESLLALGAGENERFTLADLYVDLETGDVMELFDPGTDLIFVEGVLSLIEDIVPETALFYDSTVWLGVGNQEEAPDEAEADMIRKIEHWRYLMRRSEEGRLVSADEALASFDERRKSEAPIIQRGKSAAFYLVDTTRPGEREWIAQLEDTKPVVLAFDVGGGRIGFAHQPLELSENGITYHLEGDIKSPIFEPTRAREGPNNEGKDKVLGQIALMALERLRILKAMYPGKQIQPIIAIGAPGNRDHPSTNGTIAPHSADNLGSDFSGIDPVKELEEIFFDWAGIRPIIVWNNDSLAQAYAAVRELLPYHEEYKNDTVLFLSLGTGLGMGIVKVDAEAKFSTVGDSHNFDLDFTDRFPIMNHPEYGTEVFAVPVRYEHFDHGIQKRIWKTFEIYVPTSEKGKIRSEDVASGRALRQIFSAFERDALRRVVVEGKEKVPPLERPFFIEAASVIFHYMSKEEKENYINEFGITDPVYTKLIYEGYWALDGEEREQLAGILAHEGGTIATVWFLNDLYAKRNLPEYNKDTEPHPLNPDENVEYKLSNYSQQIKLWVDWAAQFLAKEVLEVIVRTREGKMDKVNGGTSWPEEWRQQVRDLNIQHIVVGSTVATKGEIGTLFRSYLKAGLEELKKAAAVEGDELNFSLNEVSSDTKTAAIRGARDFQSESAIQQNVMQGIEYGQPVSLPPSPQYSPKPIDRAVQMERAFKQARVAAFLDLGDVVVSKHLTDPVLKKITAMKIPLEKMISMTNQQKVSTFGEPLEVIDAYVAFEQIKLILKRLVEKGVPVGVATGKPYSEVVDLFGAGLAGRIYIYALNGNDLHPPASIQPLRPGGGHYFDTETKAQLNDLMKYENLGKYGFGPARVYKDKSDMHTFTEERRTFEPKQSPGSQINVTSILGDNPLNPNNLHSKSGTEYRLVTTQILAHKLKRLGIAAKPAYAGRIGSDIVYYDKGDARRDFEMRIEELLQPSTITSVHADDQKQSIPGAPEPDAVNARYILRFGDSYAKGLGQDSTLIGRDPKDEYDTAFTVGFDDQPDDFDTLAPVYLGGGPQKTAETLSKIRFADTEGKIFYVDLEGNYVYEEAPSAAVKATRGILPLDAKRASAYEENIDKLRSRHLIVAPDGSTSEGETRDTLTGWVFAPEAERARLEKIKTFVDQYGTRYDRFVVIGMGGPGNAAGLPIRVYGKKNGVLVDHPAPRTLKAVGGNMKRTLFISLSKSGTTPEIIAMTQYFMNKVEEAGLIPQEHFAVVTDSGTPMDGILAPDRTFLNDSDRDVIGDIGGRFSLPTYFGLLPAALTGIDIDNLVQSMAKAAGEYGNRESAVNLLGVKLADALLQAKAAGRNKVTLVVPPLLAPYAEFAEQLFNESLGKGADPIVLIADEPFSQDPTVYGRDRIFVRIGMDSKASFDISEQNGLPFIDIRLGYDPGIGYLAYHTMMAVALIGLQTKINPFDQPAVEASKKTTRKYLDSVVMGGQEVAAVEEEISGGRIVTAHGYPPMFISKALTDLGGAIAEDDALSPNEAIQTALASVEEGEYVSILLATHKGEGVAETLGSIRKKIRNRHPAHPATMAGIIPIDNHSNLQLHAAEGNDKGVIIIFTFNTDPAVDIKIPREALIKMGYPGTVEEKLTFSNLKRLIAAGEFESLNKDGKRVLRIHLPAGYRENLGWIDEVFDDALGGMEARADAQSRPELRSSRDSNDIEKVMARWELAKQKTFRAEIADVDGNLTPLQDVKAKEVPPDVIEIMRGRVLRGIPMALASVRSEEAVRGLKEIEEQVLKDVPPEKHQLFFLFPENGSFASWSEVNPLTGELTRRRVDLVKYFKMVPQDYSLNDAERNRLFEIIRTEAGGEDAGLLSYHESKAYGFQIKVARDLGMLDIEYKKRVAAFAEKVKSFLAAHADPDLNRLDVVKTRTSLLFLPKGVNKRLAVRYFADRFGLKQAEIIGTDDQGDRDGNGWYLTSHAGGFSTYGYNPRSTRQLPLTVISKRQTGTELAGVDAWRFLNSNIRLEPPVPLNLRPAIRALEEQLAVLSADKRNVMRGVAPAEIVSQVIAGKIKLKGEDLDVIHLNESGEEEVVGTVDRNVAEAYGFLHRTSNAFIKTPDGKVLIQRRAHHKSQPLKLSIFGGHAAAGEGYFETIQKEVREELGLPGDWVLQGTFEVVGKEGGFSSPVEDVKNRERRALYIYNAAEPELEKVRKLKGDLESKLAELGETRFRAWLEEQSRTNPGSGEIWSVEELTLGELRRLPESDMTSDLLAPLLKGPDSQTILNALAAARSELRAPDGKAEETADPNMTPEEVSAAKTLFDHLAGSTELPPDVLADHVLAVLGNPYGFYPSLAAKASAELDSKTILVVGKGAFPVPEAERISEEMARAVPALAGKIIYNPDDVSMHTGMNVEEVVKLFKQRGLTTANLVLMQLPTGILLSRRIFEKQWAAAAEKYELDLAPPAIHGYPAKAPYSVTEAGTADPLTLFSLEHALGQIQRLRDWPDSPQPPIDRRAEDLPESVLEAEKTVKAYLERRRKIDNEAKAPGLLIDGARVYTPIVTEAGIDDILKMHGLAVSKVESVTITGGPANIPVYAADKEAGRWGSTADLTRRLLAIDTVKPQEARSEMRKVQPAVLDEMREMYAVSADILGDYENRRWVAVHIAGGIFAILPPSLSAEQKEAASGFLKRDLYYMDYAGAFSIAGPDGISTAEVFKGKEDRAALDISVLTEIKDPQSHFLAVAHALKNQPQGRIVEFILDGDRTKVALLNQFFQDEYGSSELAGRYSLKEVSRKNLHSSARGVIKETFNKVRAASGFASIAEFQEHVTFSSVDESILREGISQAGWAIVNDLVQHPGVQSVFKERSLKLSSGRLEAELIKKLQTILKEKNIIFASRDVLSDVDAVYLVSLWDSYNRDRLIGRSA